MSFGAGRPGIGGGRDHDVEVGDPLLERRLLRAPAPRRSARARSRPRSPRRSTPRSRKVAPSDSTCSRTAGRTSKPETTAPSRRAVAIACSPATPAPSTSTFAGGIVPAAVVSIGKKRGSVLGGEQHGLVARDGRLRRERVHRLRARDARDRLHRERRHAARRERLDARPGPRAARGTRSAPGPSGAARPRPATGLRTLTTPSAVPRVAERRAGVAVRVVGERRRRRRRPARPRARSRCGELPDRLGDERDTPLAVRRLARNPDPHGAKPMPASGGVTSVILRSLTHFVAHYGLWVVFGVVFLEVAGLPFVPGETALIAAGALASQGHGNIVAIIGVAIAAAVLGALCRVRRRPPLGRSCLSAGRGSSASRARASSARRSSSTGTARRRSSSAASCPCCGRRSAGWPASAGCRSAASCSGTSPGRWPGAR